MGHNKKEKICSFSSVEFWAPLMGTVYVSMVCGWLPPTLLILPVAGGGTALGRLAGGLWRQRAGQGKASDMQGGQRAMALSDVFWGGLTWVLHVPQRMVSGNTGRQESYWLGHLPAQTQTPGGGRSGRIWSSAQQWNLTKQRSGQLHPPPHRPQLPAEGQAGLLQAWPKCCNFFPPASGLLPMERKEMTLSQRWHRVLVAETCSCFSTSHTRSGTREPQYPEGPAPQWGMRWVLCCGFGSQDC